MPLPTQKDNNINNNINNNNNINYENEIDKIPVGKNNNVNFNDLVNAALNNGEYGNNNEYNNNEYVEPRFKYIPKEKRDSKYNISIPTNTKKYKYYSDNFKDKEKKSDKNPIRKASTRPTTSSSNKYYNNIMNNNNNNNNNNN